MPLADDIRGIQFCGQLGQLETIRKASDQVHCLARGFEYNVSLRSGSLLGPSVEKVNAPDVLGVGLKLSLYKPKSSERA